MFLNIDKDTWYQYSKREDFTNICKKVDEVIRQQKFEGAAAGFLNHAIIARDLGLADRRETEHSGSVGVTDMTDAQLEARIKELQDKQNEQ